MAGKTEGEPQIYFKCVGCKLEKVDAYRCLIIAEVDEDILPNSPCWEKYFNRRGNREDDVSGGKYLSWKKPNSGIGVKNAKKLGKGKIYK